MKETDSVGKQILKQEEKLRDYQGNVEYQKWLLDYSINSEDSERNCRQ